IGRPLTPPDLLMRSTAICTPTSAVLPPAAAAPDSGCSVPILYGLAWPKASRHGAGTSMAGAGAPPAGGGGPNDLRRVGLPLPPTALPPGSAFPPLTHTCPPV